MDEVEYYRSQEMVALGQITLANLWAILENWGIEKTDDDPMGRFQRAVYKYTECGATLGALVYEPFEPEEASLASLTYGMGGDYRWRYCEELRGVNPESVCALCVSSIVEGVEPTTETYKVKLDDENLTELQVIERFEAAVQRVEDEAEEIWMATHGCPDCYPDHVSQWDDDNPVNPDCESCGGRGTII